MMVTDFRKRVSEVVRSEVTVVKTSSSVREPTLSQN